MQKIIGKKHALPDVSSARDYLNIFRKCGEPLLEYFREQFFCRFNYRSGILFNFTL